MRLRSPHSDAQAPCGRIRPLSIRLRGESWRSRLAFYRWREQQRTLDTRDWVTATVLADRVFHGVRAWLLSCSSGEGGHGGFVWNHQGSGSGGWMQFITSTYTAYAPQAREKVRRLGFRVRDALWSYYEPLGQALTAGYMRWRGWSHYHWDPRIDPRCW